MSYLRFGRRLKIGPGVYVNISKSGLSLSVGPRGAKLNIGRRGPRVTLGIPGTGLSYVIQGGGKKRRAAGGASSGVPDPAPSLGLPGLLAPLFGGQPAAPPPSPAPTTTRSGKQRSAASAVPPADTPPAPASITVPTPGFLAPAVEKRFAQGLRALVDGDSDTAIERFQQAVELDEGERHLSDDFMAGVALLGAGHFQEAISYLEHVVESETELPDEMMQRYIGDLRIPAEITPHVLVDVPMSSLGAALLLTEAYQHTGDILGATGVMEALVEQAPNIPLLRLSLAELYYIQGSDEGVVSATDGLEAADEVGYAALTFRALALLAQGHLDSALEVVGSLLRSRRKWPSELVQDALFTRGMIYDAKDQKGRARQDFEKLYALNAAYPGLREWLDHTQTE